MPNTASVAKENFVKTIYKFEQSGNGDTRPGSIARELGISNAAATDMARKLAVRKLIDYEKYKSIRLTPSGKKMALSVLRKHRLWETFLHKVFGMSMHEIHREAELLEHQTSDFLAEKINMYLGNPATDPHGDPIPNENGIVAIDKSSIALSQAEQGFQYEVIRLSGSDKEFFEFCNSNNLKVGVALEISKQYTRNKMTEIGINDTKLLLNTDLSNIIYVRKIINK